MTGEAVVGDHKIQGVMARYRKDTLECVKHDESCRCCNWGDGCCSHTRPKYEARRDALLELSRTPFIDADRTFRLSE